MARLLPVVATLQRALRVDEDISDVLDVADFPLAPADLEQRIVGGAGGVGRIEQQNAAEPRPPAGGKRPVFALDVVDDRGARPSQQRGHDETDPLAGSGRRETQDMLRTVVAQIVVSPSAEQDAVIAEQARLTNFARLGPARGAISRDALDLPSAPNGHSDRDHDGGDPAGGGDVGALDEDVARIRVIGEPPPKEGRRLIDWPADELEPWKSELGLEGQTPGDPFRCSPD